MSATDFPQGPGNDAQLDPRMQIHGPGGTPVAPDAVVRPYATPDITRAQVVGAIPVVAKLGVAFGLFSLTAGQQEALTLALGGGVGLMVVDAVIRFGRSHGLR